MATKKLLTWKSLSRMGFIVLNYISKLIHIFISVVLFVEKVRKRFRGAKTRYKLYSADFQYSSRSNSCSPKNLTLYFVFEKK